jgi:dTDP-4-amino-4,6-dideoxygalactose transaminase
VSTANAVLRVGARPVFADIDDESLGLDPKDVALKITEKTTALLPIHYAGIAPDMDALVSLAKGRRLRFIEDAAQGLAASYKGQALGTFGDAGSFSFHETKNITCGEGGALALRDPSVIARAEVIREKGTNRRAFLRGEVDKYTWVSEGSSYVLSDILAAILDAQLDRLAEIQRRRAECAQRYRDALSHWASERDIRLPPRLPHRESNDHVFYLLFSSEKLRDSVLSRLKAEGIQTAFHYVPLHSSPFGTSLSAQPNPLPVTDRVARTLLRLPLHPLLSPADGERVVAALKKAVP